MAFRLSGFEELGFAPKRILFCCFLSSAAHIASASGGGLRDIPECFQRGTLRPRGEVTCLRSCREAVCASVGSLVSWPPPLRDGTVPHGAPPCGGAGICHRNRKQKGGGGLFTSILCGSALGTCVQMGASKGCRWVWEAGDMGIRGEKSE